MNEKEYSEDMLGLTNEIEVDDDLMFEGDMLDLTKEIEVDDDLMLEGDMLEMAKRMEERIQNPYEEKTPIRVGDGMNGKTHQELIAYRKKRRKKNRTARKSRAINRRKKK